MEETRTTRKQPSKGVEKGRPDLKEPTTASHQIMENSEYEKIAEILAELGEFCIQNPKVPVGFSKFLVYHWWMKEPRIEKLDEDGQVISTIKQCALCGVIVESPNVRVKSE